VIRLLNLVAEIRWELCGSEEEALLRENTLLRMERPPFNVVNKRPEAYLFVALAVSPKAEALFKLTTLPDSIPSGFQIYGAYKGGGQIQRGVLALLRVLWAAMQEKDRPHLLQAARFDFPLALIGSRVPPEFTIQLQSEDLDRWVSHLHRFLRGTSPGLLPLVTGVLLNDPRIPPFYYKMMLEDLETLREFYERGPRRHRRLVRFRGKVPGADEERIAQEELDDLLVRYHFAEERKDDNKNG
jgi:hypothetical protein